MLVDTLYGKAGHLKNRTHFDEEEKNKKSKEEEQSNTVIDKYDPKKLKISEYEASNLFIELNLFLADIEPILDFFKKHSRSAMIKSCTLNRHSVSQIIKSDIQSYLVTL